MQAEIISIGTEITCGAKLDTNSQWLSQRLTDLGITVVYHTSVADDLAANVAVMKAACERTDLVIMTGGIGPTRDDLTREALALLAGGELVTDQASLDHLLSYFESRGRIMAKRNKLQAMFPAGASPLPNPIGTAPGIWMSVPRPEREPALVAALPGVPSEMYKMFDEQVRPRLTEGDVVIRRARIHCFGIGESSAEELLGDLTARGNDPEVGITAHEATITLRIIAQAKTEQECHKKIDRVSVLIRERLGDYVFGVEDEELEDVVIRELTERKKTLAVYECATRGLLASRIASVENAYSSFRRGVVVPQMNRLPLAAAERLQDKTEADYILVIGTKTDELSPSGGINSRIDAAMITPNSKIEFEIPWAGNPMITLSYAAKTMLQALRLAMRNE